MIREWFAWKPHLAEVCERAHAFMREHYLRVQFYWVPSKENKEAGSVCKAAQAAGEIVAVLDNTGLLLGLVNIVIRSVACSRVHTCK